MPLVRDHGMPFRAFGALDADQLARMDAVVDAAWRSAEEAASLVPGAVSSWWSDVINAESTAAALRSNAAAAQTLYETLRDKRDRLASDPDAGEYDVQVMEGASAGFTNVAAREAAALLTPAAAIRETAAGSYQDIVDAVKNPLGIPVWVWALGAGALAFLILVPRRR